MHTYRMKEHFRTQETLIANIKFDEVVVEGFVHEAFEFVGLNYFTRLIDFLLVVLCVLLQNILANVAILFFDSCCYFVGVSCWELFTSVFETLQCELSDIPAG